MSELIPLRHPLTGEYSLMCPGCGVTHTVPTRGIERKVFEHEADCWWIDDMERRKRND